MRDAYDPLDYTNLARSVVSALLENQPVPLAPPAPFEGSGVYAIYYSGKLPFYSHVSSKTCEIPIYVGKAVPEGARKGRQELGSTDGTDLFRRLGQHARSIEQAENLKVNEFQCRYLIVVPVWITLAERFLISHFQPIWNTVIDGFGNHDPGKGRIDMRRPRWDIVHAGRAWAKRLKAEETEQEVVALIRRAQK